MDVSLKLHEPKETIRTLMLALGREARAAARILARALTADKNAALIAMADAIRRDTADLLAANMHDIVDARLGGRDAAFIERLTLDAERIDAMARGLEDIAKLPDPVGEVTAEWTRPNGLRISRIRVPLGVIGIIFESRPNVTPDAGGLALKSGNAVILRGGSDGQNTALAIHARLVEGAVAHNLPASAIQMVPVPDREAVGHMLAGLDGNIDVIVPRGGKSLVARVQEEARVPVFAHLEGICHSYVHADADADMARRIVINAKMRRTGICGATETVLIDRACAPSHLAPIVAGLIEAGCEVRGDTETQAVDPRVTPATDADYGREFLDAIVAVRVVGGIGEAMQHIAATGSQHTDAIITDNQAAADQFLATVDSAIVVHNASTQFADGGEFGMGAEIGIATGRLHARGPVGVEQLTTFKYVVRGSGQIRP